MNWVWFSTFIASRPTSIAIVGLSRNVRRMLMSMLNAGRCGSRRRPVGVPVPELIGDDARRSARSTTRPAKASGLYLQIGVRRRRDAAPARQRDRRPAVVPAPQVVRQHEVDARQRDRAGDDRAGARAVDRNREARRARAALPLICQSRAIARSTRIADLERAIRPERQLVEERADEAMRHVAEAEMPVARRVEQVVAAARVAAGVEALVVLDACRCCRVSREKV